MMLFCKETPSVFLQCKEKQHSEDSAGDDFADGYGDERKPQRSYSVSVQEYKWNNDCVGHDRGHRSKPFKIAQFSGKNSAD